MHARLIYNKCSSYKINVATNDKRTDSLLRERNALQTSDRMVDQVIEYAPLFRMDPPRWAVRGFSFRSRPPCTAGSLLTLSCAT